MKEMSTLMVMVIAFCLILALGPFVTQWAWGNSVASVFAGVREITWFEAMCFNVLGYMVCKGQVTIKKKD